MFKPSRLFLLPACVLALSSVAFAADDAALAAKLVGQWEGTWEYDSAPSKLTATFTAATGNILTGETLWYATAKGDLKDTFTKATLKGGKLNVPESTINFTAKVSEDGMSMTGEWSFGAISDKITLHKK
jgi:hypothetical protein